MGLDSGSQPRQFVDEEDVQACLARLAKVLKDPYGHSIMGCAFGEMCWYNVACPANKVAETWEEALRGDQNEMRFWDQTQRTPRARFDEFIAKAEAKIKGLPGPLCGPALVLAPGIATGVARAHNVQRSFVYVYEAINPVTKATFFVGRTGDLDRRPSSGGFEHLFLKQLREWLATKAFGDVLRPVPELPNGCEYADARELESYFIYQRRAIYNPITNPSGCNWGYDDETGGYISPERWAEMEQMFSGDGYAFPWRNGPNNAQHAIGEAVLAMARRVDDQETVEAVTRALTSRRA